MSDSVKKSRAAALRRAIREYEDFHWECKADDIYETVRPRARGVLVMIGACCRVDYLTDKGEGITQYFHEFEDELPIMVMDEDRRLFLIGGSYTVTEDGIEG